MKDSLDFNVEMNLTIKIFTLVRDQFCFLLAFVDIYRQKLQQCLSDGDLSEDDVKALRRLHILLCLSKETVDAAHATLCGRIFEKVLSFA
mgnify:CR=1 FL=1